MATRSLTEVYILMRNNALQNRHIYSEQVCITISILLTVNHDHHHVIHDQSMLTDFGDSGSRRGICVESGPTKH